MNSSTARVQPLCGPRRAAYTALNSTEATDYEKVKSAMLHHYEVNEETYRLRFRPEKKSPKESYRVWTCRITDKWMKDQKMMVRVGRRLDHPWASLYRIGENRPIIILTQRTQVNTRGEKRCHVCWRWDISAMTVPRSRVCKWT